MEKRKKNFDRYFLLNKQKALGIVVLWFFAIVLHNITFNLFFMEELFLVLASFVFPIYFIVSIIYTFMFRKR